MFGNFERFLLWPPLADICSITPEPRWQGHSLVRPSSEDKPERVYFYAGRSDYFGMREGRWKYFWNWRLGEHCLFDLETDPAETTNLANNLVDRRDAMNRQVIAWVRYQRGYLETIPSKPK